MSDPLADAFAEMWEVYESLWDDPMEQIGDYPDWLAEQIRDGNFPADAFADVPAEALGFDPKHISEVEHLAVHSMDGRPVFVRRHGGDSDE